MSDPLTPQNLARLIDVSCVQAFHTANDVVELGAIARRHDFKAAHVLPNFVPLLRESLGDSSTLVGAPVGFPAGGTTTRIKVAEAQELAGLGAGEMDLMLNVGRLRSGQAKYCREEIRAVVAAVAPIPIKVILEVYHLSNDEIRRGCELCIESGAAFVKTATGWTASGTTIDRIAAIVDFVKGAIQIKASGGIRDLDTVREMRRLGVARFGINTRSAVAILAECERGQNPVPVNTPLRRE